MPGPGGGGRGGGGGFGGGRGGGFGGGRGGGFGGGFHGGFGGRPPRPPRRPRHHWHYHRPHFWGGWFFRPYYYGGGMFSGMLFVIILPIIVTLIAASILITNVSSAFSIASEGGVIEYNEEKLQDYADSQYAAEFSHSSAYEDNILLVVLTDDEKQSGYYIAWVGDHVGYDVNLMFGGDGSELGYAMNKWINTQNYKYSLDSNLAGVVNELRAKIISRGYDSHICNEEHTGVSSHLTNKTDLPLTAQTVNTSLESFTKDTGIPIVIVVDEAEDVFGKTMPTSTIFTIILCIGAIVVGVVILVRAIGKRRRSGAGSGTDPDGGSDPFVR